MRKDVTSVPSGIWKQVARAQKAGFYEGMSRRSGHWLTLGLVAWGLQRLRSMTEKKDEILLREPIGPGQTITITNQTTTRAEAKKAQKQAQSQAQEQAKADAKAAKRARKARKALPRAERRRLEASEARREESARRRRRRRDR